MARKRKYELPQTLTLAVVVLASPANARCIMSYCKDQATASTSAPGERRAITNTSRQRLGDLYDPGYGRRVQIRDTARRILSYIEKDGTITNTHRQRAGTLEVVR